MPLNMKAAYLSNSQEMVVSGGKGGKPVFNSEYDAGVYEFPIPRHNGRRQHPAQKLDALFSGLVNLGFYEVQDVLVAAF